MRALGLLNQVCWQIWPPGLQVLPEAMIGIVSAALSETAALPGNAMHAAPPDPEEAMEMVALADTIKVLNDDDALELFKKTLPAPTLMQLQVTNKQVQTEALQALVGAKNQDPRVALISLTLCGGAKSFEKVIKMIDQMVALLGEEQTSDDDKKAYCEKSLDESEDEKKVLENTIGDLDKSIATTEESISTLAEEIAALLKGIADLDSQVKEATKTREEENAFYKKTMQEDTAAKDILKMAKNRLAQFYAPKMYVPPAKAAQVLQLVSDEAALISVVGPGAGVKANKTVYQELKQDARFRVQVFGGRGEPYDRYPESWSGGAPAPNLETFGQELLTGGVLEQSDCLVVGSRGGQVVLPFLWGHRGDAVPPTVVINGGCAMAGLPRATEQAWPRTAVTLLLMGGQDHFRGKASPEEYVAELGDGGSEGSWVSPTMGPISGAAAETVGERIYRALQPSSHL